MKLHVFVIGVVSLLMILASSCDIYPRSERILKYNNMTFVARSRGFDVMLVESPPPLPTIRIMDSAGKTLSVSMISKSSVVAAIGEPTLSTDNSGEGRVDRYGKDNLTVRLVNDRFSLLRIGPGVKITNDLNQLSITLPASESEVRAVFGKPTSVERVKIKEQW